MRSALALALGRFKRPDADSRAKAQRQKAAGGQPCQGRPRHTENRVLSDAARSHKSTDRLPDSPESRQQVYSWLDCWEGMSHE